MANEMSESLSIGYAAGSDWVRYAIFFEIIMTASEILNRAPQHAQVQNGEQKSACLPSSWLVDFRTATVPPVPEEASLHGTASKKEKNIANMNESKRTVQN